MFNQSYVLDPAVCFAESCKARMVCVNMIENSPVALSILNTARKLEACWDGNESFDVNQAAALHNQLGSLVQLAATSHTQKSSVKAVGTTIKEIKVVAETAIRLGTKLLTMLKRDLGTTGLAIVLSIAKQIIQFIRWIANHMNEKNIEEFFAFDNVILNRTARAVGKLTMVNHSLDVSLGMIDRFVSGRHMIHETNREVAMNDIIDLVQDAVSNLHMIKEAGASYEDWEAVMRETERTRDPGAKPNWDKIKPLRKSSQ